MCKGGSVGAKNKVEGKRVVGYVYNGISKLGFLSEIMQEEVRRGEEMSSKFLCPGSPCLCLMRI